MNKLQCTEDLKASHLNWWFHTTQYNSTGTQQQCRHWGLQK